MQNKDGMNYAPQGKPNPVVNKGEFAFAAIALDHGHIYGMCNGLIEAGADLVAVYDPDPAKVEAFINKFPQAKAAASEEEILNNPSIKLVAGAAVPSERCALGLRVMDHGKDYFTDKTPLTSLEQLEQAKAKVKETGRKYMVYYSERLHVESAVFAGQLIEQGAIGRVVQVIGFGPHRLNAPSRPDWFFEADKYGGILCDIGSHQIEQFLYFTGAKDATVVNSKVANYKNKNYPELEDFGDATLIADNGATNYFRVDWLTPDGLGTWGDGRMTILGTEGYIEIRKYIDIARDPSGDHLYLVNHEGEKHYSLRGQVGYPFFGQLVLDCINRTENAMTQDHAFKAVELCVKAQLQAVRVE
ncbi:Gfo/Idh/MocA family protein [Paenibacillus radicis (ex Xue et al. 2023)]|uniref:Gfo/Idh/MocA family oxidoreductase n=1 Tax=Paenibacillus radicis (ex Xue et al. 2023) TaxID=2972489 RepID=A0ABT1YLC5_9BACL|nr:Gfo/Idh/MocA family oxidoreductase [Paenibacillus radicis (ex Xue et al. 2023)]MCR8633982.1 Gfo/Idh/MocA family oxidoreductase [Paenibacillus radicis (ex Xue et al. 2023)]